MFPEGEKAVEEFSNRRSIPIDKSNFMWRIIYESSSLPLINSRDMFERWRRVTSDILGS